GFSFNCLTSYSDEDRKRDYLYYADPCQLFDLCKRRYSRQVALLHDYGLYEFTILVRKDA
ncbi:class I SAM-dependent methyltransferase, partial [Acinetobacter baumannii]